MQLLQIRGAMRELLNIRAAATCVRHETYLSLSDLAGTSKIVSAFTQRNMSFRLEFLFLGEAQVTIGRF